MKNKKRYWSISGGFHRRMPVCVSFAKPGRSHTHSPPLWLDGFGWIREVQTDLRVTWFIVKTEATKSICLVCQWALGCSCRWSRESGRRGGGKDSSRQMSGQLCSWTGSKAEIRTDSCSSIKGWMSPGLATSFFFSFCLMFRMHFIKTRRKFQKWVSVLNVATFLNTQGTLYEHVSREEMKSKNQELTSLWRRPTLQITHSEGC